MPKVIFNGEEGDAFTNDTDKILYQFHASLTNTCGTCLQYHMAISSYFPIPIHRNCACTQTPLYPGKTAEPWVDYRKILDEMTPDQKREAIGASNYKLLKEGVVTWDDVVTNTRVRSFREVVAREKLTIPELKAVGIRDGVAKAAWTSVHTTGHEAAAAHRKVLVENLTKAGVTPQQIREGFGRGVAARVKLIKPGGPSGPGTIAKPHTPIEPLIPLLGLDAAKVKAAMQPKAAPDVPPSTATIEYGGGDAKMRKRSEQAVKRVLEGVPPDRYASVVGAPDGAKVVFDASGEFAISYEVTHPSLDAMRGRLIRSDGDGTLRHAPDALYVKPEERGKGVGATVHDRRVAYGVEHGVASIRITAARGEEETGYIVWPIMGYDGKLPRTAVDRLPEPLQGRATIQELLSDEEGQKWWKKDGESIDLRFMLKPDGPDVKRWEAYRKRKAEK